MFVTICWKVTIINKPPVSRDRLVVRTLRCGRSNPGSNPGHGMQKQFFPHPVSNVFGAKRWGLNRDLNPGPLAPKARIIPLDHWARWCEDYQTARYDCEQLQGLLSVWDKLDSFRQQCLYSSVAERWSCKPKVMSSILIGGKEFFSDFW